MRSDDGAGGWVARTLRRRDSPVTENWSSLSGRGFALLRACQAPRQAWEQAVIAAGWLLKQKQQIMPIDCRQRPQAAHGAPRGCPARSGPARGPASPGPGRREALLAALLSPAVLALSARAAEPVEPARIQLERAPDQRKYDKGDEELRAAANMLQDALNAEDVQEEERRWTRLITRFEGGRAEWTADIVGRAYGNRGNARSRQGKWEPALALDAQAALMGLQDLNKAIAICPWSVDPVLNRGVVLENTNRYELAARDYRAVLAADPQDPSGWNNLGNVLMALGRWDEAVDSYSRAVQLAPAFSFAAANKTLALYQAGKTNQAMKEMRALLRRYPDFPDMRSALAAAEWEAGQRESAEADWARVEDARYRDRAWLRDTRRWPPRLVADLEALLDIKGVAAS